MNTARLTPASLPFPIGATEDDRFCASIAPNVWLMDDHRWAFYALSTYALEHPQRLPLCLAHIDAHADAVDGFFPEPERWVELQDETDPARLYDRVAEDTDITLASFIAPAVRRRWIDQVHFFGCAVDDDLLDDELLLATGVTQQRHTTIDGLVHAVKGHPLWLDVDLDVFNQGATGGENRLWPPDEIERCIEAIAPLSRSAAIITVARSFRFSGTVADTVWLTEFAVPRILAHRAASLPSFK